MQNRHHCSVGPYSDGKSDIAIVNKLETDKKKIKPKRNWLELAEDIEYLLVQYFSLVPLVATFFQANVYMEESSILGRFLVCLVFPSIIAISYYAKSIDATFVGIYFVTASLFLLFIFIDDIPSKTAEANWLKPSEGQYSSKLINDIYSVESLIYDMNDMTFAEESNELKMKESQCRTLLLHIAERTKNDQLSFEYHYSGKGEDGFWLILFQSIAFLLNLGYGICWILVGIYKRRGVKIA